MHRKTYYKPAPGQAPAVISQGPDAGGAARSASYQPKAGQRYAWTTGQRFTLRTQTTWGKSAWLGIDALAADPDAIIHGPYRENLDAVALIEGDYIMDSGITSDYTYDYTRINTSGEVITEERTWERSTWYGTTTYYLYRETQQGSQGHPRHSIKADRPITHHVHPVGRQQRRGLINVDSNGDRADQRHDAQRRRNTAINSDGEIIAGSDGGFTRGTSSPSRPPRGSGRSAGEHEPGRRAGGHAHRDHDPARHNLREVSGPMRIASGEHDRPATSGLTSSTNHQRTPAAWSARAITLTSELGGWAASAPRTAYFPARGRLRCCDTG